MLTNFDELDLLIVGQSACLTGGARHNDAVSTVRYDVVNELLDIVPIHFTICREGGYEGDKYLSEGVFALSHDLRVSL
jgi:hypothetical protein